MIPLSTARAAHRAHRALGRMTASVFLCGVGTRLVGDARDGVLAFKAREIEELADVYFFRPLGLVFALAARALGLTPTTVTVVAMLVGMAGGAMLSSLDRGEAAFALLILHGVLDSSDGQLARMTGQTSEFGRMLDGVAGYVTYAVLYIALVSALVHRAPGDTLVIGLSAIAAIVSNIVQAQMYDYHRTAYVQCVIKGESRLAASPPVDAASRLPAGAPATRESLTRAVVGRYEALQARLAGRHPAVEQAVAARSRHGRVRDEDRERYRSSFYWPVRGWNLFGDNTRFYAIGVLAWLHRPEWFFMFLFGPMNLAFAAVWLWQARADRRFLERL